MLRSIVFLLLAGWILTGCAPKVAPEITAQPELPPKPKLDKNIPYFSLAKEHYKAYLQTEDRTMLDRALEEIDAAHTLNPNDLKIQQFYSAIALTKIALEKDRALADKVIPFFPALQAAHLNTAPPSYIEALFLDRERERDKIADLMLGAIEENPRFAPSYQMLADLYLDQKAYNAAIETLKRGLKVDPNNVTLHLMLATAYLYKTLDLESKNLCGVKNNLLNKKILSEAKKVIALSPKMTTAYSLMAIAYERLGARSEAINSAIKLYQADPQNDRSRLFLADTLIENGQKNEAMKYIPHTESIERYNTLGHFYFYSQVWEKAAENFEHYIQQTTNPSFSDYLMLALATSKKSPEASRRILQNLPASVHLTKWQEELVAYWLGDQDATELLTRADNPCKRAEALFLVGFDQWNKNGIEEAKTFFQKTLDQRCYSYEQHIAASYFLPTL